MTEPKRPAEVPEWGHVILGTGERVPAWYEDDGAHVGISEPFKDDDPAGDALRASMLTDGEQEDSAPHQLTSHVEAEEGRLLADTGQVLADTTYRPGIDWEARRWELYTLELSKCWPPDRARERADAALAVYREGEK